MKSHQHGVEILKTMWAKDEANNWKIRELQNLRIRPRAGFSNKYFKIDNDEFSVPQTGGSSPIEFFSLFGTPEFVLRQSIVPVVAWNNGDEEVRCIGTGFFVSASGYLMTAAHVIRDPIDEKYTEIDKATQKLGKELNFGILLPANPAMKTAPFDIYPLQLRGAHWFMCPFEWMNHWVEPVHSPFPFEEPERRISLDISICKVKEQPILGPFQPLNIGLHNLNLGDRAVAIGYPEMRNFRLKGDDYEPELVVSVGSVTEIYRDNLTSKQNSTPGPNFEFDAKIPGKMSGSPILVGEGFIVKGVVSRSWQTENHASGCLVAPILDLPVSGANSLAAIMRTGNEGIPEIFGHRL